jgi:hypothetical protein
MIDAFFINQIIASVFLAMIAVSLIIVGMGEI